MYIALDIGGTKTIVATADTNGNIISRKRFPTPLDFHEGLSKIKSTIYELCNGEKPEAIGVAIGGPIDWLNGVVSPLHQPQWRNVPLKAMFEAEFGCPCYIDVDTNVGAIGEYANLSPKPERMAYITVSTGMGGALIHHGRIDRGFGGHHPEVGHMSVPPSKRIQNKVICACGSENCVEAFVSGNGIKKLYGVSPTALADEHWEEVGYYLGEGLRNIAVAYAPAVIVIGGGLANGAGEKLLSPARQRLNSLLKILPIPEVILSTLGTDSVIIGAALLAKNGFKAY